MLDRCAKAGQVLLRVAMDDKLIAPSLTPRDLFSPDYGAELVAPWRRGYLAEVSAEALARLARRLADDRLPIATKVDVSRIKGVSLLATDLMEQDFEALWSRGLVLDGKARLFLVTGAVPHQSGARVTNR